jgi:3-dehydroquinate synthase
MPAFVVQTPVRRYIAKVERGILGRVPYYLPDTAGKVFVVTTEDVWKAHGRIFSRGMAGREHAVLFHPGGEERKRLSTVEDLAVQMVEGGADRTALVVGFGGGIVNDVSGFLASIFMRGVGVVQVPTTLLAQVDAAVGGKTGVNLTSGKNLIGTFHQPLTVLIDPEVLSTLPEREYRAGLYEVIKCGVIRSEKLFRLMATRVAAVLARRADVVDEMIAESVRIKAEVVSSDEKESDLRRILNFGHTVGHALEAETAYSRFLHGEAVAIGMKAAVHLALLMEHLSADHAMEIMQAIDAYGPVPPTTGIAPEALMGRLASDKKTMHGQVHFVLPRKVGAVRVVTGIDQDLIYSAIKSALR